MNTDEPGYLLPALRLSIQKAVQERYGVEFDKFDYDTCEWEPCQDLSRPAYQVLAGPYRATEGYYHPHCFAQMRQKQDARYV
jgi:hypothetical protein